MTEILPASKYYGWRATGTVLLVNGHPYHYTGSTSNRDAKTAQKRYEAVL